MGLNGEEALRVIVDIETAPLDDAAQYLEPLTPIEAPDLSLITPAKNLVDPAKIATDIDKRKQAAMDAYREQCQHQEFKRYELLERCALDVDLCRIVAIGYQREDWSEPHVHVLLTQAAEANWLGTFWCEIGQRTTLGYNTLGFDLPVLMRRSLYLGVPHPFVSLDRYRTNHIDLQQKLSFNGLLKFRGLSFYCKRFGIPCEDETPGSQIGELVKAGEWDRIAAHCRSDVLKTKALAERMGFLKAQLEPAEAF